MQTLFKKLEYRFLLESTKIDSITFPYKTALSEANVKTYRMGSTKVTFHKERSFACNKFPFLKILFQFTNFISCTKQPNVHIHTFRKRWSFTLECFFPVRIFKIDLNATEIRTIQDNVCTKN